MMVMMVVRLLMMMMMMMMRKCVVDSTVMSSHIVGWSTVICHDQVEIEAVENANSSLEGRCNAS